MIRTVFLALLVAATTSGCGETSNAPTTQAGATLAYVKSDNSNPYLAYEHRLAVAVEEEELAEHYEGVVSSCAADRDNACTVLDAQVSAGEYASATIRMRVLPAGVDALIRVASSRGEVIERRTHVEDLEEAITDVDARIAMLVATRDKLLEIERRAVDDVDSLIKVASELSRVQSELEQLSGRQASHRQRVEKHVLAVQFVTAESTSFFAPAAVAFSEFGENLSEGIGDTVTAIAYLLPWSVLLFVVALAVRRFWRRGRSK